MNGITDLLVQYSNKYKFNIDSEKIPIIEKYYNLLLNYQNEKHINLSRITEPQDFVLKNVIDTLLLNSNLKNENNIIDMSSGNGVPGIIISILNPNKKILLVDSTKKKIEFLNYAIKQLNLINCSAIAERVEVLAKNKKYYENLDGVIGRALAPLEQFVELAAPFLKINGFMYIQKSQKFDEELKEAQKILDFCGFLCISNQEYNIEENYRIISVYQKTKKTPSIFPRNIGDYKKKLKKFGD